MSISAISAIAGYLVRPCMCRQSRRVHPCSGPQALHMCLTTQTRSELTPCQSMAALNRHTHLAPACYNCQRPMLSVLLSSPTHVASTTLTIHPGGTPDIG